MDKVRTTAALTGTINITLTEGEARALEAIVGYGSDVFVKWFYKNCGQHYLKPHEEAMRSLFKVLWAELPKQLRKFDDARAVFTGAKVAKTANPITHIKYPVTNG